MKKSSSSYSDESLRAPDELIKAQSLANITDTAIPLPIVGGVGLDFIIGLIPGVGDATMALVALRIVYLGRKMGLPKPLLKTMLRNALMDFGLGFVPVIGDIVDLFYKANRANVRIMERWWLEQNQKEIRRNTQEKLAQWKTDSLSSSD